MIRHPVQDEFNSNPEQSNIAWCVHFLNTCCKWLVTFWVSSSCPLLSTLPSGQQAKAGDTRVKWLYPKTTWFWTQIEVAWIESVVMLNDISWCLMFTYLQLLMICHWESLENSHWKHINNSNIYTAKFAGSHGETIRNDALWNRQPRKHVNFFTKLRWSKTTSLCASSCS